MIECESCFRWFHVDCVEPTDKNQWICEDCTTKKKDRNQSTKNNNDTNQTQTNQNVQSNTQTEKLPNKYTKTNSNTSSPNTPRQSVNSTQISISSTNQRQSSDNLMLSPKQSPSLPTNIDNPNENTETNKKNDSGVEVVDLLEQLSTTIIMIDGISYSVPSVFPRRQRGDLSWAHP